MNNLPFPQLEEAYGLLAKAIDLAGPNENLVLAKICMMLINQSDDFERVKQAIECAQDNL